MDANELDLAAVLDSSGPIDAVGAGMLRDAIDAASDQDRITWLTRDGRRIAAIVPVDVAQAAEIAASVLADPGKMADIQDAVEQAALADPAVRSAVANAKSGDRSELRERPRHG
jgi:hypothetical protein